MKRFLHTSLFLLGIILLAGGCIEPFDPPEITDPERILVVEGTLDAPNGDARVILSEITNISTPVFDSLGSRISNADVRIITSGGATNLLETSVGTYTGNVAVTAGMSAQLRVSINGNVYESEEVVVKPVPAIDSLTFDADSRGISIEVTTHDSQDATEFYQWSFVETVEYRTAFGSSYYYNGDTVLVRDDQVYYCWKTNASSNILIASSDGLDSDVIYKFPLVFIPSDSWKKEIKYSVLVNQYSITEETFTYLRELENNNENVGSLFDPQPGRIFGNIRSLSDPEEYVIGQFSARSKTQERLFIARGDLPDYPDFPDICTYNQIDTIPPSDLYNRTEPMVLITSTTDMIGNIVGYLYSSLYCMDCRVLRGGTNIEPDFWE